MKVLQLNLNHCEAAHDLLAQTVRDLNIQLVMISEPYKHPGTQLWVSDASSKASIWSCDRHLFQNATISAENGFVRAKLYGINFYSCYAPPSLSIEEFNDLMDRLTKDVKQYFPVAIAGDFNAWAVDWGSKETNEKGKALLEAMSSLDVVLLNIGDEPTFARGEASSIVDVTFVSSNLAKGNNSWRVSEVYTASDHRAIVWEVTNSRKHGTRRSSKSNARRWKVSYFNPNVLRVALNDHPASGKNATEKVNDVMRRVIEACDATMPRKKSSNVHSHPVYWWNDNIATLRRECIKTRRLAQRGRKKPSFDKLEANYKEARRKLNKAIKSSKKRCWDDLLEEVEKDTWGRPYKVVMTRLKSQPMTTPTCPILLERIVTTLFPQQLEFDHGTERFRVDKIPSVTEEELIEACGRVGNTKAPGPDGIPNIALKAAIHAATGMFLDVYDSCLQEGTFPTTWKQQRLVLLPKGKKPPEEPSSYRPLCMLDSAGKILERIVHKRIEPYAEAHLSDNQYGFRRGRSTLDAIDLVVETARVAITGTRWRRGTKQYCLVVTLDVQNAFNSAKWDFITNALNRMEVPGYLQRMITSYFTNRILQYDTEKGPKWYKVTGGVPQGSVLGPLLWNVMYDGLLKLVLPSETKLVAFADDVAIVIVSKHLEEINFTFDETFSKIRQWMHSAGLKLAEHKTEAVLVTGRKLVETTTLQVGDYELTTQPYIRYLGVMIDSRLSFKKQVEYASAKASTVRATLCRLMPNIGGPKQRRRKLLSSVITSVLTYGIAIWGGALKTNASRRILTSVYRLSALRIASAYRTVSEEAVCVIAGILPFEVLVEERRCLYQGRKSTELSTVDLRSDETLNSLHRWQILWDAATNGRWTHHLIPQVAVWMNREHGEVNYYLTQLLSGHGCFRAYLHKYKHVESPECPKCSGELEDAEHVFFKCPRFVGYRRHLEGVLGHTVTPGTLVESMLAGEEQWVATSVFAANVLKQLRQEERMTKLTG